MCDVVGRGKFLSQFLDFSPSELSVLFQQLKTAKQENKHRRAASKEKLRPRCWLMRLAGMNCSRDLLLYSLLFSDYAQGSQETRVACWSLSHLSLSTGAQQLKVLVQNHAPALLATYRISICKSHPPPMRNKESKVVPPQESFHFRWASWLMMTVNEIFLATITKAEHWMHVSAWGQHQRRKKGEKSLNLQDTQTQSWALIPLCMTVLFFLYVYWQTNWQRGVFVPVNVLWYVHANGISRLQSFWKKNVWCSVPESLGSNQNALCNFCH